MAEVTPNTQHLLLTLEVALADGDDPDPALVGTVGRDLADRLRREGHTVQPVYTGQRGGNLPVDISLWLVPFLQSVWQQKEILLADGSALVTILGAAVGLKHYLQQALEKRVGKTHATAQPHPITLTLEVTDLPIRVEVPDVEQAEELIAFVRRLEADQPVAKQVTTQSHLTLRAGVPGRTRHKQRPS